MTILINFAPGGAVNSRFDYTYDDLGRRSSMITLDGTWTYSYDATGQLTHAVFASNNPANISNQDLGYEYDAVGNRVQTIQNGAVTNYTVNGQNQYTTVGGTTYTYESVAIDPQTDEKTVQTIVVDVTNQTRTINGVTKAYDTDPFFVWP